MSNRIVNSVSAFAYDPCGALRFVGARVTAGSGTGEAVDDPLGTQGALALDRSCRFLFAVNAGVNTVSSFRLDSCGPTLASVLASGGARPVALAVCKNLLYVVNAGDANSQANLSGFCVGQEGVLLPIPGSTVLLSMSDPAPGCAAFTPDGRQLVVSERNTNFLTAFSVESGGRLIDPVVSISNGLTPTGMAFTKRGVLLVAEAGPSALTSYELSAEGNLTVISASVASGQAGTRRVAVTPDGCYAYTTGTLTGTVSVYRVSKTGDLTLVESVPTTPLLDGAPTDLAVDPRGKLLYALNGARGSISAFQIGCEGHPQLIQIYEKTALPEVGAQGLAVC